MGLQIDLLEKPRTISGGRIQARCPACAESGGDTQGEHLVVYPDGRFGCCLHPGDKQHRKRIFALVGKKRSIPVITVRRASRDQPARQWTSVSVTMNLPAPPTAANRDSELPVPSVPESKSGSSPSLVGTLGTPFFNLCALQEKIGYTHIHTHGSLEHPSQASQPTSNGEDPKPPVPSVPEQSPNPYIDADGNLRIPFDSPAWYHWWKGGQSIAETLSEVES
jgi:hypothetical protein